MVSASNFKVACGGDGTTTACDDSQCKAAVLAAAEPVERPIKPVSFNTVLGRISTLEFPFSCLDEYFCPEDTGYDNLRTTNTLLIYSEEYQGRCSFDESDWVEKDIGAANNVLNAPCAEILLWDSVEDNLMVECRWALCGYTIGSKPLLVEAECHERGTYTKWRGERKRVIPFISIGDEHQYYIIGEAQPTTVLTLRVMQWVLWYCHEGYRPKPVTNKGLNVEQSRALHMLNECWLQQVTHNSARSFLTNGDIWIFFKVDGNDRSAMVASRIYHQDGRLDPYSAMMPPSDNMPAQVNDQRRTPPHILCSMALSVHALVEGGGIPEALDACDLAKPQMSVTRAITVPRSLSLVGQHELVPQLFTKQLRRVKIRPATTGSGTWHRKWFKEETKNMHFEDDEQLPSSYPWNDSIELDRHLGNGHLGDVFSGTLTPNYIRTRCAFKIVHSGTFDEAVWDSPYSGRRAILTLLEEASFMALLGPDGITPKYIGAWLGKDCLGRDYAVVAMEELGAAASTTIPEADKQFIIKTFEALHNRGFMFGYTKLAHICRREGSKSAPWALIDLESLGKVKSEKAETMIANVKDQLGLK